MIDPPLSAGHHDRSQKFAKLEYLYVDLGRTSGSFLTTIPALGGGFLTSNYSSRITDNVLRVGVNYKFGGPVVAKY